MGYPDPIVRSMAATLDLDSDRDELMASVEELVR